MIVRRICTLFSSYSSNAYKTLGHKSFRDSFFFTRINCNTYYDATGERTYALVTSHIPTMYIVYVQQHYFGGRRKKRAHGDLVEAVEKRVTSRQPQPPSRLEAYTFYRPPSQDLQLSKCEKERKIYSAANLLFFIKRAIFFTKKTLKTHFLADAKILYYVGAENVFTI